MSSSRTRLRPRRPPVAAAAAGSAAPETGGFRSDLRAVLRPERAWHHLFPVAVLLTGVAYWVLSLLVQPGASWAEIALYRPKGDNQVYPIITALSQFNLGDPTDAVVQGQGVGGFQAVILLPYVVAFAALGPAGYLVADALLSWAYFVGAALFLRRCGAGAVSSLWVAAGLATQALPLALAPVSHGLRHVVGLCGLSLAEWDFPDLTSLLLFQKRIPRPMVTEVFLVFLFYFLARQWRAGHPPTARWGVAVGFLMSMLVQGDPYSFGAAGLVLLAVLGAGVRRAGGRVPWPTVAGILGGGVAGGAYFLFQLWHQDPEAAARFGLAPFPRDRWWLLPGYGPCLRLAVIGGLAWGMVRWGRRAGAPAGVGAMAAFAVVLAAGGWLAMPLQLLLLGKGAQIYHYFYFTFPTFYAYASVVLGMQLLRLACREGGAWSRLRPRWPQGAWAAAGAAASGLLLLLPVREALEAARHAGTARHESSPWAALGPAYRLGFRELDRRFREDPRLRQTRTFGTFHHEANFLLTAFHGKRAILPDNAYSTLPDAELERRLFLASRLLQFSPAHLDGAVQNTFLLNYWLGCAKYWCADDYKFAPDHDYTPQQLHYLKQLGPLPPFNLALPRSEAQRISQAYRRFLQEPLDPAACPDTIVLTTVLWSQGAAPIPGLYEEIHRDNLFAIYLKTAAPGPAR